MKISISILLLILISCSSLFSQTTIQQRLVQFQNDGVNGGTFSIDYEIKGTNLPTGRTLGSLTLDILYNSTILTFNSGTNWNSGISTTTGCNRSIQSAIHSGETYRIRIGILTLGVNENGGGDPPGYDLIETYDRVVRINFTILNSSLNSGLTIFNITNQVGLYQNPHNQPMTNIITNQTLSPFEGIDVPLPITLSSFTSIINKNNVDLKWKTSSEINNKEFQVERKMTSDDKWISAGVVQGKGNSSIPVDYTYTDRNLLSGKYEYRLKQVDINGNFEYHSLHGSVVIDVPDKFDLSQNYPNPFNPSTKINFQLPTDAMVEIKIFDLSGREILTLLNEDMKAGYYTKQFNASSLSSGIYFYRIIAGKYTQTKKMMLIK